MGRRDCNEAIVLRLLRISGKLVDGLVPSYSGSSATSRIDRTLMGYIAMEKQLRFYSALREAASGVLNGWGKMRVFHAHKMSCCEPV